jgi:hypothetical protein
MEILQQFTNQRFRLERIETKALVFSDQPYSDLPEQKITFLLLL